MRRLGMLIAGSGVLLGVAGASAQPAKPPRNPAPPAAPAASAKPADTAAPKSPPPPLSAEAGIWSAVLPQKRGPKPSPAPPSAQRTRTRVTLYRMPPTRTYCTFDEKNSGQSATIEWDPLRPGPLVRELTLDKNEYQFACHTEPARNALRPELNFAWTFDRLDTTDPETGAIYFRRCEGKDGACETQQLGEIKAVELPSIRPKAHAENRFGLPLIVASDTASLPLGAAQRAFGGLSEEAVGELFKVIAEVAVEKARGKATKLLQVQVKKLVCEDLKDLDGKEGTILLPRTCDSITHIRFDDLAGTGHQIVHALAQDFAGLALKALFDKALSHLVVDPEALKVLTAQLRPVIETLADISLDAVAGKHERFAGAGPRILIALSQVDWSVATPAHQKDARLVDEAVHIAFAIVAELKHAGKIDPARMAEMIDHPEEFFSNVLEGHRDELEELRRLLREWKALPTLVSAAARVLSPSPDTTEVARIRAMIGVTLDITELFLKKVIVAKAGDDEKQRNAMLALALFGHVRDLLDAAVQEDLPKIITASATLVGKLVEPESANLKAKVALGVDKEQLQRFTRFAGSIGAYLSTYASGQKLSAEEQKARHDARKAALTSLIDSQLERGNRLGVPIVSVGATLGITPAKAWLTSPLEQGANDVSVQSFHLQPMLNVGVALDYHGNGKYPFGVHLELAPINIGSYLTVRSKPVDQGKTKDASVITPSAADALSPSATLGVTYLLREADIIFLVGATGGYAFKAGNDAAAPNRAAYVGGTVGFYIPFYDFN